MADLPEELPPEVGGNLLKIYLMENIDMSNRKYRYK
jgi:hypothetical protein